MKTELFDWIIKIIESCTDDFHFEGADRVIELFNDKFKDEEMYFELKMSRTEKWNQIHAIVKPELNK